MLRYAISRFWMLLLSMLLFTLFVFALMHMAPGDPVRLLLNDFGAARDQSVVAAYEQQWGLDQSLPAQYLLWLTGLLQGKLGTSYLTGLSVTGEIASRLAPTLTLIASSYAVTLLISIPLGIGTGLREHSRLDRVTYALSVLGLSIPLYWLAIILMLLFGVLWPLLPIIGSGSVRHYVLPVLAISIVQSFYFIRMLRSFTVEYKQAPYIEAAQARGLKSIVLYPSYLFRSMLVPFITLVGSSFPAFFGAAIVMENIFSFPGIGKYMLDMINRRDFPVIQGCSLIVAAAIFLLNYLTDLCYYAVDPRIQLEKQRWEN
ncbi:ABC transporter permease [Paenibacillus sp. MAHUQ-46]|uniref:ABC transporter permease n=2 Tax=Paenibacillus TaxID=44249 RepID=A0A934J6N9_9BACL|nr:ABC transporter permease [Paenibacillus roseus]MBJ6361372.1 ABC transporter permease [Paenibacillus roseus]